MPETNLKKDLIIFLPGLGGDINNFSWLGSGLSKKGWPVIFIEHQGSDSVALNASIKGDEALPGGADIYLYRIKDLDFVINSYKQGQLGFKNSSSYILMGHSLGALISMLYEGNPPNNEFISRCENALGDFALTNLSKLLQCQLSEIPIPEFEKSKDLKGIVGFNSFGSLIWSDKENSGIDVPILFIGGTFDLITPLISEQVNLFGSFAKNNLDCSLNRGVIKSKVPPINNIGTSIPEFFLFDQIKLPKLLKPTIAFNSFDFSSSGIGISDNWH